MVTIRWTADAGWHDAAVVPYGPLSFDPASMVLHYGQEIFEGLKAYRQPDGSIASFRPEANAARFRGSASRLAMAELPDELFLASLSELLAVDHEWVPAAGGEDVALPAPVHAGHRGRAGRAPVGGVPLRADRLAGRAVLRRRPEAGRRVAVHRVHPRRAGRHRHREVRRQLRRLAAARRRRAPSHGCAQVAYLDAEERTWVDEMGSNNLFFVFGSGDADRGRHARAHRQHPGGRHPRLAARAGQGAGLPGHRAPDLGPGVARRRGRRAHHRGVRLRHRGGDHPDRRGQARGRRGADRRRRARPGHPAAARPADRRSSAARRRTRTPGCARSTRA